MRIEELTDQNILFLQFEGKNQLFELPITLIQSAKGGLLIEPIEYMGRVITFEDNEMACRYNLICTIPNDKPLIWTNVSVSDVIIKKKKYVLIKVSGEGAIHNRRSTYRLPLELLGELQGYGKVLINDISYNGVSFYLNETKLCNIDQAISLSFKIDDESYVIQGRIVRQSSDKDNQRNLYGCRINPSINIDRLIQEEQMKHIRGRKKKR